MDVKTAPFSETGAVLNDIGNLYGVAVDVSSPMKFLDQARTSLEHWHTRENRLHGMDLVGKHFYGGHMRLQDGIDLIYLNRED